MKKINLQIQFKRKMVIIAIFVAIIAIILLCVNIIKIPSEIVKLSDTSSLNSVEPYKIMSKDELDKSFDEIFYSSYLERAKEKTVKSSEYRDYILEYKSLGRRNFEKNYDNYYRENIYQEECKPQKEMLIKELNIVDKYRDREIGGDIIGPSYGYFIRVDKKYEECENIKIVYK